MDQSIEVRLFESLCDEVRASRIKLYRSLLGEPYVFCDLAQAAIDGSLPALHVHIFDDDFRAWLQLFAWHHQHVLLTEKQIERLLYALSGMSLCEKHTSLTETALLRAIENDVTVAALVEFMRCQQGARLETTMEDLWKSLREFAARRNLLQRGKSRFPGGANILSRRLRESAALLERLSLRVTIGRSNGSKVIVERLDDYSGEPSAEPPAHNSHSGQGLTPTDDRQSILTFIRDRRGLSTNKENTGNA